MSTSSLDVVILGLAVSSSWGNGHATTYRALVRALGRAGHRVTFLERDVPWYRDNRDCPAPDGCKLHFYESLADLRKHHSRRVRSADAVIVGSYVPDGVGVGTWVLDTARGVTAFYDIDTPVTLAKLERGEDDYVSRALIGRYDLYLSFTGGPTLERLTRTFGARKARALYCSVDPELYKPTPAQPVWELGYLGTYSEDRQATLDALLTEVALRTPNKRFVVAGPCYPVYLSWPTNVDRTEHVDPSKHGSFYARQRFTLNVTRADMIRAGWSPSVRLFEAAACGVPIITDTWDGLDSLFEIGRDVLVARSTDDVNTYLRGLSERERIAIAQSARERILTRHTAAHRAAELVQALGEVASSASSSLVAVGSGR